MIGAGLQGEHTAVIGGEMQRLKRIERGLLEHTVNIEIGGTAGRLAELASERGIETKLTQLFRSVVVGELEEDRLPAGTFLRTNRQVVSELVWAEV
jgi:hypothetical protein